MSVPSLRLDQRASEAYPAVNPNFVNRNTFSHGFEDSGKTAAEIRTDRIGFSDNNPLNFWFWSSTPNDNNNAWNVNFSNGKDNNNNKSNKKSVRCVRW